MKLSSDHTTKQKFALLPFPHWPQTCWGCSQQFQLQNQTLAHTYWYGGENSTWELQLLRALLIHPYKGGRGIAAGLERPRVQYTACGHCPINEISGVILTHGFTENMGKLFLLSFETAPGRSFPAGGCREHTALKRCSVEVSHSRGFLVPGLSLTGFKKLLTEKNGC